MNNPLKKKYVVDLFGEKQKFVDAAIKNLELSNEMSGRLQTLVATIILAQLAFLGALGFDREYKTFSAWTTTVLVVALLVHLIAVSWQQTSMLRAVKLHFKKANEVDEIIQHTHKPHISPEEYNKHGILESASAIALTKKANRLMFVGYVLGIAGTVMVVVLVWRIVS